MAIKPNTLETIKEFLEKARRRLSDESADYSDMDDSDEGFSEDGDYSDEDETDDAAKWLEQHSRGSAREEVPEEDGHEEDSDSEVEKPEIIGDMDDEADSEAVSQPPKNASKPPVKRDPQPEVAKKPVAAVKPTIRRAAAAGAPPAMPPEASSREEDDMQPSREELAALREYTRPWEMRQRDRAKLVADARVNPGLHHEGRLVEARNAAHGNRHAAQQALHASPEYQKASKFNKMKMDNDFAKKWNAENPQHLSSALVSHHEAHKKGEQGHQLYNQTKDEKIRHIASGGVQPGAMSLEEGMQHAGGTREDEDSAPTGIQQDKAAQFAGQNKDYLDQFMADYNKKGKRFDNAIDVDEWENEQRPDTATVLGSGPAFKDSAKKQQYNQFMARYHPLIEKAKRHVLAKLGLTQKAASGQIDERTLHEAGIYALHQAINDYDHDHHSQAKFTTHLNRKMHGLMQAALKGEAGNDVPEVMRAGAKKFDQQNRASNAAPVKHTNAEGVTTTIAPKPAPVAPTPPQKSAAQLLQGHHPDRTDRLQRVVTARAPLVRRGTGAVKPAGPRKNFSNVPVEDDMGEE